MSDIKINKLGVAVSTFSEDGTHPFRYEIIEKSLSSLLTSIKRGLAGVEVVVVITIDGKVPDKHVKLINKFADDFEVVERKVNGGVSKVKNTGIRCLLEKGVDVGILVDDDVLFHEGWVERYVSLIEDLQLHHLTWNDKRKFEDLKLTRPDSEALKAFSYINRKGHDLIKHPGSSGIFLTFTPDLIEKIGYFKVMPGKIGNEHQHFTLRANRAGMIGHPIDLADSFELIEHIGVLEEGANLENKIKIHSVSNEFHQRERKNSGLNKKDLHGYFPCQE